VIAKASRVFNAAQVDGYVPPEVTLSTDQITPIEAADRLIRATGARVTESGDRAFYSVTHDQITMPDRVRFTGTTSLSPTEGYYAVLLHELTHWSGAKHRLDRGFGARFGEDAYAMEALVAELGAAFLCADLHITPEPRPDHAAYIDHWLRILKSDRKAIFAAASAASRAAEYLSAFTQDIQVAA
jgi:antirestriction protein ArdC